MEIGKRAEIFKARSVLRQALIAHIGRVGISLDHQQASGDAGTANQEVSFHMNTPYSIDLHAHRLAAWAACTAARASKLCRFSVENGTVILEQAGFTEAFVLDLLPDAAEADQVHRQWRDKIIQTANSNAYPFTHGVAAKLLNVYMKVRFVCGGHHEDPRVAALHPPIDRVLLTTLEKRNFGGHRVRWRSLAAKGWSNFDGPAYEETIELIRASLPSSTPLWTIEEYWQGYQ